MVVGLLVVVVVGVVVLGLELAIQPSHPTSNEMVCRWAVTYGGTVVSIITSGGSTMTTGSFIPEGTVTTTVTTTTSYSAYVGYVTTVTGDQYPPTETCTFVSG
jgi:hypothetical protein